MILFRIRSLSERCETILLYFLHNLDNFPRLSWMMYCIEFSHYILVLWKSWNIKCWFSVKCILVRVETLYLHRLRLLIGTLEHKMLVFCKMYTCKG